MQHRGERRGLGGIFFDDLNDYDQEMLLSFATGILQCQHFLCGFIKKKVLVPVNSNFTNLCNVFMNSRVCKFCGTCIHSHYREKEGYTIHRSSQSMATIAKRTLRRIQLGTKTSSGESRQKF